MKQLVIGILAHVDSGKTTLTEAMLYQSGELRRLGRVDHKDAFLDTHALERERGITIFSKQAVLQLPNTKMTLLDTPGHVDFSAEMERTLQVLDYAILMVSGSSGVQSHTETLWRLLERYRVPTFIFINKMDVPSVGQAALLEQLRHRWGDGCVDFSQQQKGNSWWESLALCDEVMLNQLLETGAVQPEQMAEAITKRRLFPCFFGSALRLEGVQALLDGLDSYARQPQYGALFGAKVFKVAQDAQGNRLTHLKITGGRLAVRETITPTTGEWQEKVHQIRLYSGEKFQALEEATAGMACAVTGLSQAFPGQGLGAQADSRLPVLQPVLTYRVQSEESCPLHHLLEQLRRLEQEDPQLQVTWDEAVQEIHLQLMGPVQLEILQRLILDRFGIAVTFGKGNILYKETLSTSVEGIGHFEPLRHYAEVHLRLDPLESGRGLHFATECATDTLDKNWQRLILTHLQEKIHLGVLTGSPITDLKITLTDGRAHPRHTEGGDFRQATYRAVRHGLKSGQSVLLEPWIAFRLELPTEGVGRAMADLQRFGAQFSPPERLEEGASSTSHAVIIGSGPVATLGDYQSQLTSYTQGRGRFSGSFAGYQPCHNTEEVIAAIGYSSDRDVNHPADSVFCKNGAGFVVPWQEVRRYSHLGKQGEDQQPYATPVYAPVVDAEILAIFERTYGPIDRDPRVDFRFLQREAWSKVTYTPPEQALEQEYLLVDGYNILFAWEDTKKLAAENVDAARHMLINQLCSYQGVRPCKLILVFDAYKVKGNPGAVEQVHNISVVYTKEAETADMYIEKVTHQLGKSHRVRVATSDTLEQLIILGHGAQRISAPAFWEEVQLAQQEMQRYLNDRSHGR